MKNIELANLLNIVTDLSAEAVVAIQEGDTSVAENHLTMLQSYIDHYMESNNLRQVTEVDEDYEEYMKVAYSTTSNKQIQNL